MVIFALLKTDHVVEILTGIFIFQIEIFQAILSFEKYLIY